MLNDSQGIEQLMEEELLISHHETADIQVINENEYTAVSTIELENKESSSMILGIIGCGAIASIITDFAVEGKLGADLKYF
ncbi:MAG TPA: hypothetical protein VMC48_05015, partial [Methanobacterium sp.]|nr:hypothetical protein [Methanobacterium sp.]